MNAESNHRLLISGAADHAADRYRQAMTACLEGRGYRVG
jgi:hypothetical protein